MSAEEINRILQQKAPALYAALSPMGRRAFFPQDIPAQAQEARQTTYNGTIGNLTDGQGGALPLPSMDAVLDLSPEDRNRAFLYSPVPGNEELRERWRAWQREGRSDEVPSTLPLVTVGLSHGLSMVADLFGGEGRVLAVPAPFWGNYRQTFTVRAGAEVRAAPLFRHGRFNPRVIAEALGDLLAGEPALAMLNFPSNPAGYSPTMEEREELRRTLLAIADQRPLVVLCDDAYSGLVYGEGVPRGSLFWELAGAHEQLVPIKIDGATKEFAFFGGRVGFLTFGLDLDREAAEAVESKLKWLLRATLGSPVATSQAILLQALRSGQARRQVAQILFLAEERYRAVQPALEVIDRSLLRPLPFNSGFFALIEIPEELGITAEQVRYHLIAHHDTGIVSIGSRYLRIAICSVAADMLPELVARVVRGVRELAGR